MFLLKKIKTRLKPRVKTIKKRLKKKQRKGKQRKKAYYHDWVLVVKGKDAKLNAKDINKLNIYIIFNLFIIDEYESTETTFKKK